MIRPKRTFEKILREWGHDILLQRVLENGNFSPVMERVTVRNIGQSGLSNTKARKELEEGIVTDYDGIYYMQAEIAPKEGDRIYEAYSAKVGSKYTIFIIDSVTPVRGRFGEVVFWVVGATRK